MLRHPFPAQTPPQDPILKHRQYDTPRLTPVYKKKHIYSYAYFNLHKILDSKLKTGLTSETEMKYKVTILGVHKCSNSDEVTENCGLWLPVLLGMWNIAGHFLGL